MEASGSKSPKKYLDQAIGALRDLGITPPKADFTPINVLLDKITVLRPGSETTGCAYLGGQG